MPRAGAGAGAAAVRGVSAAGAGTTADLLCLVAADAKGLLSRT
eukprot:COSAG01_NODE_4715_length_4796_cov_2.941665_8_plen_42_part_01